jgi:hypothetical protein
MKPGVMMTEQERREAYLAFAEGLYEATRTLYHAYQFDTGRDLEVSLKPWAEVDQVRRMIWLNATVDQAKEPLITGLLYVMADGIEGLDG